MEATARVEILAVVLLYLALRTLAAIMLILSLPPPLREAWRN